MNKKFIIITIIYLCCLIWMSADGAGGALNAMDEVAAPQPAKASAKAPAEARGGKLYGIGSVSKIFTTAAVMKLAEDGQLDIDEPVAAYIPDFEMADARYRLITPRMLLNHSSGLMGMTADNAFLLGDNDTYLHDHFLEMLKTQTLKHDPGDRSIYSNDSFTLAEILVERVSGLAFTDYIKRNFAEPLGLENIETPQSILDWNKLAPTYLGNSELEPQNLGVIGSGGIYATVEDLCRFATIFMDSSDGVVLSKSSVDEMAKVQHQMEIVPSDADTAIRYGLGWDCVELYPFNKLDIKALSKGGSTFAYFTNLTILPEHNLAAAVACSGADGGLESLIAQEIILAVLEEEGLIPAVAADGTYTAALTASTIDSIPNSTPNSAPNSAPYSASNSASILSLPEQNLSHARVPENIVSRAGIYAAGVFGQYDLTFTEDSLILTPLGVRNERPLEFVYNTDGKFVSTNGDYVGIYSAVTGAVGNTSITFEDDYLVVHTYENLPGLSITATAMPYAQKLAENPALAEAWDAWVARDDNEYLLISEKYTSAMYINMALAKTLADDRIYGYVSQGIYASGGVPFPMARITDARAATGFQNTPTMSGRDIVNLTIDGAGAAEYLHVGSFRYINSAAAVEYSMLGDVVAIGDEPTWVDIDIGLGGKTVGLVAPENGSWFVYDDKMNCIATSLEAIPRSTIILPEGGRLLLAGEPGAEFTIR